MSTKADDVKALKRLQEWKEEQPCTDCGQFFPHYVLQFDHTGDSPPKHRKNGLLARARTVERLLGLMAEEEVELVCANCHCIRTHERRVAIAC